MSTDSVREAARSVVEWWRTARYCPMCDGTFAKHHPDCYFGALEAALASPATPVHGAGSSAGSACCRSFTSPATPRPEGLDVLAVAKKAAEYGRAGKWTDDLAIALSRIDHAVEWVDPERANGPVRLSDTGVRP